MLTWARMIGAVEGRRQRKLLGGRSSCVGGVLDGQARRQRLWRQAGRIQRAFIVVEVCGQPMMR
jgi:hypothetical protein